MANGERAGPAPEDIAGPASAPSVSAQTVSPATASASVVAPGSPVQHEQQQRQQSPVPQITVAGPSSYADAPQQPFSPMQPPPRSFSPVAAENTPFTTSYPYQVPAGGYPAPAGGYPYYGGALDPAVDPANPAGPTAAAAAAAAAGADNNTPKTFSQRMAGSDEHWQWKLSLRVLLCVLDLIGIGAVAAVTADGSQADSYGWYYFQDSYILPFCLIPLGVSFIWCLIVVLVLLLRRPPRAVHPGVAVGIDLVLWLTFIVTLLFTVAGVLSLAEFGSDTSDLEDPYGYSGSYSGSYSLAPNGTWVYVITDVYGYYYNNVAEATTAAATGTVTSVSVTVASAVATTTAAAVLSAAKRAFDDFSSTSTSSSSYDPYDYYSYSYYDPDSGETDSDGYYVYPTETDSAYATAYATPSVTRHCASEFTSCAQQDAYVNQLWHDKSRRYGLDIAAAVVQGAAVLLHFALFVWACVDTHRRNRSRRATAMTANLLQDMRQRGYVMVPTGEGGGYAAAAVPTGRDTMFPYPPAAVGGGAGGGYAAAPGQQPPAWPSTSTSRAAEKAPAAAASAMPRYG